MRKVFFKVIIFFCCLGVCACAHAEDFDMDNYRIYWVDTDDTDKDKGSIMVSDCNGASRFVANIGYGYLLEGNTENDVYYAVMRDENRWDICRIGADSPIITLVDSDIVRILAYQGETVYYIASKHDEPILISLNSDNEIQYYPYGKYAEEFSLSVSGEDVWDDSRIGRIWYSTTVSEDGKIAYCIEDYTPWVKANSSIYVTTSNQADIYIDEGSQPAWLDGNSLLYIGTDSKLYRYSVIEGTSQLYVSATGKGIAIPAVNPIERMIVIDKAHIGYIQMYDEQNRLTLLSLRTGEIHTVDEVNPLYFMDAIVRITSAG